MEQPRLVVRNWIAGVAAEWKCSCGGWHIELPSEPMRPQEKAAIVTAAYAEHIQSTHTTPLSDAEMVMEQSPSL